MRENNSLTSTKLVELELSPDIIGKEFLFSIISILQKYPYIIIVILSLYLKALAMFFTGTIGIVIGGPIAILLISMVSPETVGGAGPDAVWRGLSTLAGSWIGGGANQTAMLEIYGYNQKLYGGMVFVDIVVANIWMAIILMGIGKSERIDKWLKSDTSAIEALKEKVSTYSKKVERNPSLSDLMIIAAIAFGTVSISHFGAGYLSAFFEPNYMAKVPEDKGLLKKEGKNALFKITEKYQLCQKINKAIMLDYAKNFNKHLENGASAILSGNVGSGKTHLACSVANYIIKNLNKTVLFLSVIEAISKIKERVVFRQSRRSYQIACCNWGSLYLRGRGLGCVINSPDDDLEQLQVKTRGDSRE